MLATQFSLVRVHELFADVKEVGGLGNLEILSLWLCAHSGGSE